MKANCWKKAKNKANYVEEEEDEIKLFVAQLEDTKLFSDIWFLDTDCSNHMTGIRSLFKELDESHKMKIRLGDDKQMQVEGEAINNGHGKGKLLYNVFFIPSLSQNLLSVGQLMASGYCILFEGASWVVRDKKLDQVIVDVSIL